MQIFQMSENNHNSDRDIANNQMVNSFGYIMSSESDFMPTINIVYNIWQKKFFDLFKCLLNNHPSDVENYIDDPTVVYMNKFINPIVEQLNGANYNSECKSKSNEEYNDFNPKFIDLTNNDESIKLTNPTEFDLQPAIVITDNPFISNMCINEVFTNNYNIQYPHIELPIMTIHPSIRNTNKFRTIFNNEIGIEDKNNINPNSIYSRSRPIIEISLKSLLIAFNQICVEINGDSGEITEVGKAIMEDKIKLFSTIATALTIYNLRKDANQGIDFVHEIYDRFCNNYQNAIINQQYMFTIINKIFDSNMGKELLSLIASEKSTSSFEFLDKSSKESIFFKEILETNNNKDTLDFSNNLQFIIDSAYNSTDCDAVCDTLKMICEQKESYTHIITKITNYFIDGIMQMINGGYKYETRDKYICTKPFTALQEVLSNLKNNCGCNSKLISSVFDINITRLFEASNISSQYNLIKDIQKSIFNNPDPTIMGGYSNMNWNKPTEITYTKDFLSTRYGGVTNDSSAMENVSIELEVLGTKKSNIAMNEIATKCSSIATFEDAMDILLKTDKYLDLASKSKIKEENVDTIQFKRFMMNAHSKIYNILDKFTKE